MYPQVAVFVLQHTSVVCLSVCLSLVFRFSPMMAQNGPQNVCIIVIIIIIIICNRNVGNLTNRAFYSSYIRNCVMHGK